MIGDSASDVIGAKNIGALSGAALWDSQAKQSSLVQAGAELFFHRVSDFSEWLMTNWQGNP